MFRKLFHLIAFLFLLLPLGAAGQMVQPEMGQLSFHSDYEAELFAVDHAGAGVAPLAWLLALSPEMTEASFLAQKQRLLTEFETLEAKAPGKAGSSRRVNYLFRQLRATYFLNYQPVADLSDVLQAGNFNCVSSSALMALALDHFGIAWELVEKPGHVYLNATCKGRTWQVETTSESVGVFRSFSMDVGPFGQVGAPEFSARRGLRELAGLQYYNDGLQAMDAEAWTQAFDQFGKAWLLMSDKQVAEMLEVAAIAVVDEGKVLLVDGHPEAALLRFRKVHRQMAADSGFQLAVLGAVLMQAEHSTDYAANVRQIELACEDYPFLVGEERLAQALSDCWLLQANACYTRQDVAGAEAALAAFEKVCGENPQIANAPLAADVYAVGWVRLVKAGQMDAAESMLARGLRFAPQSEVLTRRKRATLAMGH